MDDIALKLRLMEKIISLARMLQKRKANARNAVPNHVSDEDKLTRCFADSGQNRQMYIINESGLYSLIFGSKLESAKRFKRWVTSEVLPAIRKNNLQRIKFRKEVIMVKEYGFTNYIDIGNTGNDVPMDSLTPEERKKVAYALQEQVMRVSGMRRVTKTNSEQSERTSNTGRNN